MAVHVPEPVRRTGESSVATHALSTSVVATAAITLKALLVLAMVRVVVDPGWASLEGKAPVARAVLFPLLLAAVPAFWVATRRTAGFPWLADLLVTLACVGDFLGNRLDLYDAVAWFDDGMHLVTTASVSVAFVLATGSDRSTSFQVATTAIAAGLTASLAWELFEYGSFLTRSTEWTSAYSDTIGDLTLGWIGSVVAALVVVQGRRMARGPDTGHDR